MKPTRLLVVAAVVAICFALSQSFAQQAGAGGIAPAGQAQANPVKDSAGQGDPAAAPTAGGDASEEAGPSVSLEVQAAMKRINAFVRALDEQEQQAAEPLKAVEADLARLGELTPGERRRVLERLKIAAQAVLRGYELMGENEGATQSDLNVIAANHEAILLALKRQEGVMRAHRDAVSQDSALPKEWKDSLVAAADAQISVMANVITRWQKLGTERSSKNVAMAACLRAAQHGKLIAKDLCDLIDALGPVTEDPVKEIYDRIDALIKRTQEIAESLKGFTEPLRN